MPAVKWSQLQKTAATSTKKGNGGGFRELPEDTYTFVVKDPGIVRKNNAGDDQIAINPAVEGGEYAGLRVFHNFNLPNDDADVLNIVFSQLSALGLTEEVLTDDVPLEAVAQSLAGRRFVARVVKKKDANDPNKVWTNLKGFQPAPNGPMAGGGPGNPGAPARPSAVTAGPGTLTPQQTGIPAAPQGAQPQQWSAPAQQAQAPQQAAPEPYADPWTNPQQGYAQQPQQYAQPQQGYAQQPQQGYAQAPQQQAPQQPQYTPPQGQQAPPAPPNLDGPPL